MWENHKSGSMRGRPRKGPPTLPREMAEVQELLAAPAHGC